MARQGLQAAADDHQQIVEVVSDAAGELADRLHLLALTQGLVQQPALGIVDDDADDPLHIAVSERPALDLDPSDRAIIGPDDPTLDVDPARDAGLGDRVRQSLPILR